MTLSLYDRVIETTQTGGTGPVTLLGAVTGYQSFAVVGNGNSCYFFIYECNANGAPTGDWEVAFGSYTAATPSLSRTTIISSSNNGNPVNFTAGTTKRVVLGMPASKFVYIDNNGQVKFTAGTASAPAINFGTTNTGIFDVYGTGQSVGITQNGAEQIRIDAGGFFYSFALNNRFYNGLQIGSTADVTLTSDGNGKLTISPLSSTSAKLTYDQFGQVIFNQSGVGNVIAITTIGGTYPSGLRLSAGGSISWVSTNDVTNTSTTSKIYAEQPGRFNIDSGGIGVLRLVPSADGLQLRNVDRFSWGGTDVNTTSADTALGRNAAGVVEINNGTAGQYRDLISRTITASNSFSSQSYWIQDNNGVLHTLIQNPSLIAGRMVLSDGGGGWDMLQFGGTTSSFPALKRNSATLEARLADDSALATFKANVLQWSQDTWQLVTNGSNGFLIKDSGNNVCASIAGNLGNTTSFVSATFGLGIYFSGTSNWGELYAKGKDQLFQLTSLLGSTTTTDVVAGIDHRSTATPAAGFGCTYQFQLQSSTTVAQPVIDITGSWATATHASRKGRGTLGVWDTSLRECVRWETDGSNPMVGFYGVNAVARQLLATGAGHTVDDVISALQTLGLLRQS